MGDGNAQLALRPKDVAGAGRVWVPRHSGTGSKAMENLHSQNRFLLCLPSSPCERHLNTPQLVTSNRATHVAHLSAPTPSCPCPLTSCTSSSSPRQSQGCQGGRGCHPSEQHSGQTDHPSRGRGPRPLLPAPLSLLPGSRVLSTLSCAWWCVCWALRGWAIVGALGLGFTRDGLCRKHLLHPPDLLFVPPSPTSP